MIGPITTSRDVESGSEVGAAAIGMFERYNYAGFTRTELSPIEMIIP